VAADRVICISRFTADEAIAVLGVPARKIDVVYNGCDLVRSGETPRETPPPVPVPKEFYLFVGSLEPGKNLMLLRNVYEAAASRGVTLPPLVIIGARWEGVAHEGKPPKDWHYLGRQPDEVLIHLYRQAIALVFPSKYEGFGLPVAEAMAMGCPVICSPVASLPEVAGDAALLLPLTSDAYLEALRDFPKNAERQTMIARGKAQAARFSWLRCATDTLTVYEAVVGKAKTR
jgi:glycosyltransferase involved in cell wall biosynthesis